MNPTVRIEHGYYLIDTDAWVEQRVGERADDFTALLREFTGHDLFRDTYLISLPGQDGPRKDSQQSGSWPRPD